MTTARAVRLHAFGGPSVAAGNRRAAASGCREVEVRQTAVGFNYIDVYQRKGIYRAAAPTGLGHEAAGVEAVGRA